MSAIPQNLLETPALLLDRARMDANIDRMRKRMQRLGVAFRPHVKTAKCVEAALAMAGGEPGPITVSTLREADFFAERGFKDILYAVGIAPNKLDHAARLMRQGVRLTLLLDSVDAARAVGEAGKKHDLVFRALIELDTDGNRAGLAPESPELLRVAEAVAGHGSVLDGVLTHAGSSYECRGDAALRAMAEQERAGAVRAAERLRQCGHPAPVVSVGSTPTALFAEHLDGVTEVRAGVFVFFDLVMAGLGVCRLDDIAISVLASVIGHQREKGWTLIDAGWTAMSRDHGTAAQDLDQGYGLVCDAAGKPLDDYLIVSMNQEHGVIAHRSGEAARLLDMPVGTQLRILPNHACATGTQHPRYQVLAPDGTVAAVWERFSGW